ncbi:alpha/beta hydrolase [Modicisalibacter xianhensis]|uniref:alpha/beta hydrolase n=1 Tax=Modicisalibacter xianhensis TaxID=442341 RepID=UPI0015A6279B|nr:alpha/beta hydrolase [Halomonas xianhensis]
MINAEGLSRHPRVAAGPVAWQIGNVSGYHLVAIDDAPCHPVSCGLIAPQAAVAMPETTIQAIYIPPPIVVNLREPAPDSVDRLSDTDVEQLRLNGNNATIFVHGYNVPHGNWARFTHNADLSGLAAMQPGTPKLVPNGSAATATLCQSEATDADERGLNGSGACNWLVNMEYQLNRAAGLPDDDWRQYTRIVGVFWPGDTGTTEFIEAEFAAMKSGRRLVNILVQLIEAGITINLISHSLGARVVLTALNILGAHGMRQRIDNLFLWEPAVADNALSPDTPFTDTPPRRDGFGTDSLAHSPAREVHPLGMGTFPTAHLATNNVVVLHSHEDGILGPSAKDALIEEDSGLLGALRGIRTFFDDTTDDQTGKLGGAYTKKWWTFPPIAGDGLRYFQDYYFERCRKISQDCMPAFQTYTQQKARNGDGYAQWQIERAWDTIEQAIVDEARRVATTILWGPLRADTPLPTYDLLQPLSHHYRISESMARLFAHKLRQLAQRDGWQPRDTDVRPALGLIGFESFIKEPFFEPRISVKVFDAINQSLWFPSHSAMKYPTEEIFVKSYQDGIMKRLMRGSRFGDY